LQSEPAVGHTPTCIGAKPLRRRLATNDAAPRRLHRTRPTEGCATLFIELPAISWDGITFHSHDELREENRCLDEATMLLRFSMHKMVAERRPAIVPFDVREGLADMQQQVKGRFGYGGFRHIHRIAAASSVRPRCILQR
jgi:hypothetical protein